MSEQKVGFFAGLLSCAQVSFFFDESDKKMERGHLSLLQLTCVHQKFVPKQ